MNMKQFWIYVAIMIFGCSKAETPLAPTNVKTVLEVTAVDDAGQVIEVADVFLNGVKVGTTPYRTENVSPGVLALRLEKAGYQIYTEQFVVELGGQYNIEALLSPLLPTEGELLVHSNIDSIIIRVLDTNNNKVAESQEKISSFMLPAGAYIITGEKEGFVPLQMAVEIDAGKSVVINLVFEAVQAEPPSLSFITDKDTVTVNEPFRLTWSSNGSHVVIDQGVGTRGPTGSETLTSSNPGLKIFTATAYGNNGKITLKRDSVFIKEALAPLEPVIFLAVTGLVTVNTPANITWHAQNADYVVIDYVDNPELQGSATKVFSTPGFHLVTATAFNQFGYATTTDTIEVVESVVDPVADIIVIRESGVRADKGDSGMINLNAGSFEVVTPGTYKVIAEVWYDSGDEQRNESFYLQIRSNGGQVKLPTEPNAGFYKVVADDPGTPHTASRESGAFELGSRIYNIDLFHYAKIANTYPQFLNGDVIGAESVKILGFKLVYTGN